MLLRSVHHRRESLSGGGAKDLGVSIPFPKRRVSRAVAQAELAILERTYPNAVTALRYGNPFELLIAVILSAQCTDARVNLTTPTLFAKYPDAAALARAGQADVERIIKSCGFFRTKAKNIIAAAQALAGEHGGEVPDDRAALEALPGVGRKTANVVLSVVFAEAAFAVDTHVFRVSHRLGLTLATTPRGVEDDVTKLVPPEKWRHAHHWLILHGREICKAPVPRCGACPVTMCPSRPIVARALREKAATRLLARSASGPARRGGRGGGAGRPARSS
jgi:endonuclease III